MLGLYLTMCNGKSECINNVCPERNSVFFDCSVGSSYFALATLNKFMNDKILYEDDGWIVLFDGVLLNKEEIIKEYKQKNIVEYLICSVKEKKIEGAINACRGSFAGVIYDKKAEELYCFNDHWSNKPLFYSFHDGLLVISSEVNEIVGFFKNNDIFYKLNLVGAYSLITYAYMYGDNTLIEGVNRMPLGSVLKWHGDEIKITQYHKWEFNEKEIKYHDAIEKLDSLFLGAVEKQLKKNDEYGYTNVIPLSAGLDCRMTSFATNRLGKKNVINYSYSESGQDDAILPAKMARELKNQWIYKNLDNGLDLYNIDQSIQIADGLIYYPWVSQLNTFLEQMNTNQWGIVHTGVIGDVIIGSFHKSSETLTDSYKLGDGAYSTRLISTLQKYVTVSDYSYEEGMILNRAINGACMGYSTSFRHYAEAISPFMDVDFAEFCFSLPHDYRIQHRIYYDWVLRKYPNAAKFSHNGVRISNAPVIRVGSKYYHWNTVLDLLINKIKAKSKKNSMNPLDYWYENNDELHQLMDSFFYKNREYFDGYKELFNDINYLYDNGNTIEKTMVISLLGSYKNFF